VIRPIAVNSLREHMDPTANTGNGHDVNSVNSASKTDRKAYRREWMRDWRERQRNRAQLERQVTENNQANNQIAPEMNSELSKSENIAEPELELKPEPVIPAEQISEADKYADEVKRADPAAERLRDQLKALAQSEQAIRRHQQQVDETNQQIAQVFHFWKQAGLSPDQEQIFRADPAFMIRLTDFAHNEAIKLHPINSPEYFEMGKKLFFQHLDHLQQQAKQNSAVPQPESESMPPNEQPPEFFRPTPAPLPPRRQAPSRSGIVSAPVTRETGLLSDSFDRKQQHTLTAQEVEAARISNVTPAEYLKQKLKYQMLKAQGQVE
jgi:hypothetical protein